MRDLLGDIPSTVVRWRRLGSAWRLALATLLMGLTVALLAGRAGVPVTIYDGVVVEEPYRYVSPGPGEAGNPSSYQMVIPAGGATSPPIVAATTEQPPQAQLIAADNALTLVPGTSSLSVVIQPLAPSAQPASGAVAGNVYRVAVANDQGTPIAPTADGFTTVVLRAPAGTGDATVALYGATGWQNLVTQAAGQPDTWTATVPAFGDFGLVTTPSAGLFGLSFLELAAVVAFVLGGATLAGYLWWENRRSERASPAPAPGQRGRRPQKRRRRRR